MRKTEHGGTKRVHDTDLHAGSAVAELARRPARGDSDARDTPLGTRVTKRVLVENLTNLTTYRKLPVRGANCLAPATRRTRQRDTICKNIIGRTCAAGRLGGVGGIFGCGDDGALALVDEPAGEHGGGVFFEPLVEKGSDLFAEIGSVGEARKFVGLKRGARGRKEKLPRGLGAKLRQGKPPGDGVSERLYIT
jgi:hypothetical protein